MAKTTGKRILEFLIGCVIGAVLGITIAVANFSFLGIVRDTFAATSMLRFYVALVVAWFASVLFHELGHVVAGLSQGDTFAFIQIGPLRLSREAGQFRWRVTRKVITGGFALTTPTDSKTYVRRSFIFAAGGPLGSLLTTLVFWQISKFVPLHGRIFPIQIVVVSALMAVVNLVPRTTARQFKTDGARMKMVLRDPKAGFRWHTLQQIAGLAYSSTPVAQWPAELMQFAREQVDDTLDGLSAALKLYCYEMAQGNHSTAADYLDRVMRGIDSIPEMAREHFRLEAAYFEAMIRKNPTKAREWLNGKRNGMFVEKYSRLRSEAAVLLAEGKLSDAARIAREAFKQTERVPKTGSVLFVRSNLEDIIRAVESFQPSVASATV